MTTTTERTTYAARTGRAAFAGALAGHLSDDLSAGRWTPTGLDRRLARFLLTASAGDGQLTAERLRAVLQEGGEPFLHQPDNRFAALLARLIGTTSVAHDATVHALLRHLAV
ncbi:hypothetical protein AB0F11_23240 [Streptomyces sp. NPDC032472]|uniref:hypothetical protein n=1 Tax=Streptomyces sp. NPDC032472 TaxID=3155018 RepID=UPI00340E6CAC